MSHASWANPSKLSHLRTNLQMCPKQKINVLTLKKIGDKFRTLHLNIILRFIAQSVI